MIIPKSSLEPFGFLGMPTLRLARQGTEAIHDALNKLASDARNEHLSPAHLGIMLRYRAVKAGAYCARILGTQTLDNDEVIFKVAFTLEPHGTEYYSFPSYYPQ